MADSILGPREGPRFTAEEFDWLLRQGLPFTPSQHGMTPLGYNEMPAAATDRAAQEAAAAYWNSLTPTERAGTTQREFHQWGTETFGPLWWLAGVPFQAAASLGNITAGPVVDALEAVGRNPAEAIGDPAVSLALAGAFSPGTMFTPERLPRLPGALPDPIYGTVDLLPMAARLEPEILPLDPSIYRVADLPPSALPAQRSWMDDYGAHYEGGAGGPSHDPVTGRLWTDIDGRPIAPGSTIIGRQSVGGEDVGLREGGYAPEDMDRVATLTTGRPITSLPPGELEPGVAGRIWFDPRTGGPAHVDRPVRIISWDEDDVAVARDVAGIEVANNLTPRTEPLVRGHEVGHAIEVTAVPYGLDIPNDIVESQLRRVYNDLNNPDPARRGILAWNGPNRAPPPEIVSPESQGYRPGRLWDYPTRELWAEFGRAYRENPNYVKSIAPDAAYLYRQAVNSHPELSRYYHYNIGGLPPLSSPSYAENAPFDVLPYDTPAPPFELSPLPAGPLPGAAPPMWPPVGTDASTMFPYYRPPLPPARTYVEM